MTRLSAALTTMLALLARVGPAQDHPSFPASRELVRLDVVVVDDAGAPVRGLEAEDFEVVERGRRASVASLEEVTLAPGPRAPDEPAEDGASAPAAPAVSENRAFLVLFDDVNLGMGSAGRVRTALVRILESDLGPGDVVTLLTTTGIRFTARDGRERRHMAAVVRGLRGERVSPDLRMTRIDGLNNKLSDDDAVALTRRGDTDLSGEHSRNEREAVSRTEAEAFHARARGRAAASLAALGDAIGVLEGFRGRKSLILYSEGFVRTPDLAEEQARVVARARRARVAVYFSDAYGQQSDLSTADGRRPGQMTLRHAMRLHEDAAGSAEVALATGGRALGINDQAVLFRAAARDAADYYLVGFDPPPGPPGERRVEVRVRRRGLTVRAPDRYFAGGDGAPDRAQALRAAGTSMFDDEAVPFRVSTATAPGGAETTVTVVVPRDERIPRTLDLRIEVRRADAKEVVRDGAELTVPHGPGPARVVRTHALGPGLWQARVVLYDRATGNVGSLLHTFEVPGRTRFEPAAAKPLS